MERGTQQVEIVLVDGEVCFGLKGGKKNNTSTNRVLSLDIFLN